MGDDLSIERLLQLLHATRERFVQEETGLLSPLLCAEILVGDDDPDFEAA